MTRLSDQLLAWYDHHGRHDLPWKQPATPYRVWVSEIMLQQTQVGTVVPYFERFMQRFPDIDALGAAGEDEVLALWSGLGYYRRARFLHAAARQIHEQHGGQMPENIEQVMALPGIGRSTAGAILSLGYGQSHPILDGNVKRVFARVFAVEGWPGQSQFDKTLWKHAEREAPEQRCDDYNQALMDLGATLCARRNPHCSRCPLSDRCQAHAKGVEHAYPATKPKKQVPVKHTGWLVAVSDKGILLEQRPGAGVWAGMWSFPEFEPGADVEALLHSQFGLTATASQLMLERKHQFTHFQLRMQPHCLKVENPNVDRVNEPRYIWYKPHKSKELALPTPVQRLLNELSEEFS